MVVVAVSPKPASGAPKVLLLSSKPVATAAPAGRALPLLVPSQRGSSLEAAAPGAQAAAPHTSEAGGEGAAEETAKPSSSSGCQRRKESSMNELEQQVIDLEEENQKLLLENQLLREKTHGLVVENEELRQGLGMDALVTEEEAETKGNGVRPVAGSAESAAGASPVVTPPEHLPVHSDGIDSSDSESDILWGILDNLDPVMFFRCPSPESTSVEELPEVYPEGPSSLPASPSPSLGLSSAKLEAINELINFDHIYTKSLVLEINSETESQANMVVKIEEAPFSSSENDHLEITISVKEEVVEDDFISELGISNLLSSSHCLKSSSCLLDAYCDCGYEGSLSPFSDMPSPLDVDHSWGDTFANN